MKRENEAKEEVEEKSEFEFCKICRINHKQGRRHNFYPRHTNSLSSIFSRFLNKISPIKSSLTNATFNFILQSSSIPSFWCIFCEIDVHHGGTSFSSGNAIEHLASEEHLKNLKHFLWKYGGGMNKVDSFRVTHTDLAKWKKRCAALGCEAGSSSKKNSGLLAGPSNDIQPNCELMNNFDLNSVHFLDLNVSNTVVPLQYHTNENYQAYQSDISEAGKIGPSLQVVASNMPLRSEHGLSTWSSTVHNAPYVLPPPMSKSLVDGPVLAGVHKNQSLSNEMSLGGYLALSRISSRKVEDDNGNVHSGAPPPWLEGSEAVGENRLPPTTRLSSSQNNSKRLNKLNPKRVGAAWAERRKRELEMESRGEILVDQPDPEWLPNFGRVWQSGSRKESVREFKKEKLNVPRATNQPKPEVRLQPYVSKRMRQDNYNVAPEVCEPDHIP